MPTPPPSRRFRFGLRLLFVLVVIVSIPCAWVGYQLNRIRQRYVFRNEHQSAFFIGERIGIRPKATAPAGLWMFGEKGATIVDSSSFGAEEKAKVERLFPEAAVFDVWEAITSTHAETTRD